MRLQRALQYTLTPNSAATAAQHAVSCGGHLGEGPVLHAQYAAWSLSVTHGTHVNLELSKHQAATSFVCSMRLTLGRASAAVLSRCHGCQ
jgi:hypothetical protein